MTGLAPFDPAVKGPDPTAQHVEQTPRRIRVRLGSRLVADSSRWSDGTADVIESAADR